MTTKLIGGRKLSRCISNWP